MCHCCQTAPDFGDVLFLFLGAGRGGYGKYFAIYRYIVPSWGNQTEEASLALLVGMGLKKKKDASFVLFIKKN